MDKNIKKKKILIQARSIFLQGILLKKLDDIKKLKLSPDFSKKIIEFEKWCVKKNISRLEACIYFIRNIKFIDYITIGINSEHQLKEIIKIFAKDKKYNFKKFAISDLNIIDPSKW